MEKKLTTGVEETVVDNFIIKKVNLVEPYKIKKMGTSGLRLTQEEYNREGFLEQFAQGVAEYFAEITDKQNIAKNNKTILLGGDPRLGNLDRIRTISEILVANRFNVIMAENGLSSTPAMSHAIRHLEVAGGIVLTASHNPFTDVGIKINMADGSPALTDTTDRINELQNNVLEFYRTDFEIAYNDKKITEVNIIKLYADLLDNIFDFNSMKDKLSSRAFKAAFDSMRGAAGPFAREVFINRLGMNPKMLREEPDPQLGGYDAKGEPMHPEPDFDYVEELIKLNNSGKYDLVAAWDSDVDRRLDGGKGFFIESSDEFGVFAMYIHLLKLEDLFGAKKIYFCRSTVTSAVIDRMSKYLKEKYSNSDVVQTPTGFKWIAELGNWGVEESNGVGNPYLREKDGIFSTVFLLKIMLETGKSAKELIEDMWHKFGRIYFTRGEVSGKDALEKELLINIFNNANESVGKKFGDLILESTESWDYQHPDSGEIVDKNAAWVFNFSGGNTVKARFSGTGSGGYTLRVYASKFDEQYDLPKSEITQPMKDAFDAFLVAMGFDGKSKKYTDANQPDPYKID